MFSSLNRRCDGKGLAPSRKGVDICIPAGVDDGIVLKLASLGNAGTNGRQPGDLFVRIQVSE